MLHEAIANPDILHTAAPACASDGESWCSKVYGLTGSNWLANSADWLLAKPATIVFILIVALIVRWLARRGVDRMVRVRPNGKTPALLRSLNDRASGGAAATERRRQRAKTIASVIKSVLNFIIFGTAVVLILGELGMNITPILTSAGVLGVAIGFGAQTLVRDFLSGMFMMIEDQYGVGDVIDVGEAIGTVESVGLRVTTLRDLNGTVWYVRNGEVLRVGNFSQGYAVAVVDVPVSNQADTDHALGVIERVLNSQTTLDAVGDDMLETPKLLGVESVTAEGITLRATLKTKPGTQWATQRVLRARIVEALREEGIPRPLLRLGATDS